MTEHGIVFDATQSPGQISGSGNSNLLDEYEEGTWSPTLSGTVGYTVQTGIYVKTGGMCDCFFELTISSWSGASAGTISLPFTAHSAWYTMCTYWNVGSNFTGTDHFGGHLSDSNFNMLKMSTAGAVSTGALNWNTTGRLSFGLTYKTTT